MAIGFWDPTFWDYGLGAPVYPPAPLPPAPSWPSFKGLWQYLNHNQSFAGLWKYMPVLEAGSYYVRTSENVFAAPVTVPDVYREPKTKADGLLGVGRIDVGTVKFDFWTQNLSGIVPKVKDKYVDAHNVAWRLEEVLELDRDSNGYERYKCTCKRVN